MFEYEELNEDEKRILREKLNINRMSRYYLEDNDIVIMGEKELLEYIYLDDIKKVKDALNFINRIMNFEVDNINESKTIRQIILEKDPKVMKLSDRAYAYKE